MNKISPQRCGDAEKKMKIRCLSFGDALILLTIALISARGQTVNNAKLASSVQTEFLHAWNGYKQYCWGQEKALDFKNAGRQAKQI